MVTATIILRRLGVPGVTYGQSSGFHLILGMAPPSPPEGDVRDPGLDPMTLLRGIPASLSTPLHCGMLMEGVHLHCGRGLLSTAHDTRDVEQTLDAVEQTLRRMQGERLL